MAVMFEGRLSITGYMLIMQTCFEIGL